MSGDLKKFASLKWQLLWHRFSSSATQTWQIVHYRGRYLIKEGLCSIFHNLKRHSMMLTCHHTDSKTLPWIHASTLISPERNMLQVRQSLPAAPDGRFSIWLTSCANLLFRNCWDRKARAAKSLPFALLLGTSPSISALEAVTSTSSQDWLMVSLKTTTFDHQYVNLC
jgi:hypothetical protein